MGRIPAADIGGRPAAHALLARRCLQGANDLGMCREAEIIVAAKTDAGFAVDLQFRGVHTDDHASPPELLASRNRRELLAQECR